VIKYPSKHRKRKGKKKKKKDEAQEKISSRMGQIYTNVVVSSLTCLDKDNKNFRDLKEFIDADGILVSVSLH